MTSMNQRWFLRLLVSVLLGCSVAAAQEAEIVVHADQVSHRISRYLAGACIEDVNHEIYGGLYSQMIFGESFQEPPPALPMEGFKTFGGRWVAKDGVVRAEGGDGPMLISDEPAFGAGEVGVEMLLPGRKGGNAGLIVKVNEPGVGADKFTGYEVALDSTGHLVLGRHRQNWEPIRNIPCEVPADRWIRLVIGLRSNALEVLVDGKSLFVYEDTVHPLGSGRVGLRTWQREAQFRNLYVQKDGQVRWLRFETADEDAWNGGVSGMWRALRRGSAQGAWSLETD